MINKYPVSDFELDILAKRMEAVLKIENLYFRFDGNVVRHKYAMITTYYFDRGIENLITKIGELILQENYKEITFFDCSGRKLENPIEYLESLFKKIKDYSPTIENIFDKYKKDVSEIYSYNIAYRALNNKEKKDE